jgi:peptidoglycan/LPS O-acetylase OafA/YrhL
VLAACLFLKRTAGLIALFVGFSLIFLLGLIPAVPDFVRIWSNPIIFEFLAGVMLALVRIRFGILIPLRVHPLWLLFPIMVLTWLGNDEHRGAWQSANYPLAFVLVALCVLGRDQTEDTVSRALSSMGAWSYSLYLWHELVTTMIGSLWHRSSTVTDSICWAPSVSQ